MYGDTLMDALEEAGDLDNSTTINVLIAYEDVPAGQHAMRILADLARKSEDDLELHPKLWRFDLLADPEWWTSALTDAVNADMLIISTSGASGLPTAVEDWVNACLAQMRGTSAAVIALLGTADHADRPSSPRFQFVQRAANEAELDFFAPLPCPEDSLKETLKSIQRRAETVTQTFDDILDSPTPRAQAHHWS